MNDEIPNLTAFDEAALGQAFAQLERQAREAAAALDGDEAVEAFRLKWVGQKQGRLKEVSGRWLKAAPPEAKKALGLRFNALKAVVEGLLDQAAGAGPSDAALAAEAIDITLPGATLAYQAADAIRDGRLTIVLAGFEFPALPIHIVYPTSRLLSAKVRTFIDLVIEITDWHFE